MPNDYDVGYGKPPRSGQFKPGVSGNPKGRPKGTKNLKTDLAEELAEIIAVKENGKAKRVSKQRATVKSLISNAVKGDPRAQRLVLDLMLKVMDDDQPGIEPEALSADDKAILQRFAERLQASIAQKEKGDE